MNFCSKTFGHKYLQVLFFIAVTCGLTSIARAQSPKLAEGSGTDWALDMFSETNHDFGVVARGAEVKARITVKNIYHETVVISSVSPSCSCTRASMPEKTTLNTYESTEIELSMDTVRFSKHKDAVVTVRFSQPQYGEVKIPVQMYVRSDVVLTPGGVNFGTVEQGNGGSQQIQIAYAGFPDRVDWSILEAKSQNEHLDMQIKETSRTGGGASNVNVNYVLSVNLKPTAPQGALRALVQLVTNDASNPHIPVVVEANIEGEFSITPETLILGTLQPGAKKTFNVVIKGRKPFAIDAIECESATEAFRVRMPEGARPVHVVPMEFTAPETPGAYKEKFTVTVADQPEAITFKAIGQIAGAP